MNSFQFVLSIFCHFSLNYLLVTGQVLDLIGHSGKYVTYKVEQPRLVYGDSLGEGGGGGGSGGGNHGQNVQFDGTVYFADNNPFWMNNNNENNKHKGQVENIVQRKPEKVENFVQPQIYKFTKPIDGQYDYVQALINKNPVENNYVKRNVRPEESIRYYVRQPRQQQQQQYYYPPYNNNNNNNNNNQHQNHNNNNNNNHRQFLQSYNRIKSSPSEIMIIRALPIRDEHSRQIEIYDLPRKY